MDNDLLPIILVLMAAYLIGSVPSAYLAGRLKKGIDIRTVGTLNMGAMNVFYEVGFIPGLLVLVVDISKGALAVALAGGVGVPLVVQLLAGVGAVVGHSFPLWLRFRGGKGGATVLGILSYLMPLGIPVYLAVFSLVLLISRFPTFSYSVAFLCMPFIAWLIYHDGTLVIYSIALVLLPGLQYVPRVKEIRSKSGNWRSTFFHKSLKDRR